MKISFTKLCITWVFPLCAILTVESRQTLEIELTSRITLRTNQNVGREKGNYFEEEIFWK